MKYIYVNEQGYFCIDRYLEYLKADKKICSEILDLSDDNRWDISSKKAFHDSVVVSLSYSIDWESNSYSAQLKLLGPMKDRFFVFEYDKVSFTSMKNLTRYGDLFIHELIHQDGQYIHSFIFDDEDLIIHAETVNFIELEKM